ncbi:hypothetical protein [Oscillibacter sp.]|uniref:hypothetical protein n=1 Tax=Oscillibacter sp. TaxID=1945593 RepID=UPI00289C396F|nr:hypothetical protein [Oscillibacter sp.]
MEQSIKEIPFGVTVDGQAVRLFRIPNSTNDYVEVSTYGCSLKSVFIHNRRGALQNMLAGFETLAEYEQAPTPICGIAAGAAAGDYARLLAHKVWKVEETGDNYVLMSCATSAEESGCAMTVGVRIMWVNLNRLVVDLYVTPEQQAAVNFACQLPFRMLESGGLDGYVTRTFCATTLVEGEVCPISDTSYADMAFQPVEGSSVTFISGDDEVKPMAELANVQAGLTVSVYGNLSSLRVEPQPQLGSVLVSQSMMREVTLGGGETLSGRVIYGFDKLLTKEELENPESSCFGGFC